MEFTEYQQVNVSINAVVTDNYKGENVFFGEFNFFKFVSGLN